MSDYSKATNFTSKDTLPTGNSGKIVKGTELDTEFTAIASAVASKADISSPALLGTPTAPTASSGTNTTQLATTSFVTTALTAALTAVYPIGSIYINAGSSTNPNTLLGFGTWAAFGAGKVMVGLNSSDTMFDTLEETGGSKDSIVVSHTHTTNITESGHQHFVANTDNVGAYTSPSLNSSNTLTRGNGGGGVSEAYQLQGTGTAASAGLTSLATTGLTVSNTATGSSGTNANVQPYIVVNMWKRTA
jgi:hypothetical protein